MKKIDDFISVVIPVYNSEVTLDILIQNIRSAMSNFMKYELIFIDDHSKDRSYSILRDYALNDNNITVIRLGENVGQQRATLLGIAQSKGDYIVIMDDDLAHSAADIVKLYYELLDDNDVVYGISEDPVGKKFLRIIGSKARDRVIDKLTDKPRDIKVSSFRILRKHISDMIVKADTKFIYLSMEILLRTKKIGNVTVDYKKGGPSNYNIFRLASLLLYIVIYYSKAKWMKKFRKKFRGYYIVSQMNKGIDT